MSRARISCHADLARRWRPADRRGPVCGYTFRGKTCQKKGAHQCEPRADRVVRFFAELLVHTKGPLKRTAFILLDWQEYEIIRPLFGEVVWSTEWSCYLRRYRLAYIVMARKSGKSQLAAGILLYLLVGDDEQSAEVYCLDPKTRILHGDLTWRPVGEAQVGDDLIGFDEHVPESMHRRAIRPAVVTSIDRISQPCYRITLADGRQVVTSAKHRWLAKNCPGSNTVRWLATESMSPGSLIRDLGPTWENDKSYGSGYLAGIYDGKASFHRSERSGYRISFVQLPGSVMDQTRMLMKERGFEISNNHLHSRTGVENFSLTGAYNCFRFLGSVRPARLLTNARSWWEGRSMRTKWAEVASVEFIGDREVVAIGTSTKTLFAEGLASHNCAAKDTKQAGKVFEPALRMMRLSPVLAKRLKHIKNARRIIDEKTFSHYEIITSNAEGELGHNPHGFNLDEVLSQPDASLWEAMTTAVGARLQELLFATTTETDRPGSFGADLIDEAERVQVDPARAPHVFAFVRKMPRTEAELAGLRNIFPGHPDLPVSLDVYDERNWKWPNPALDQFLSRDALRRAAADARNEPAKEHSFRQFRMNQRVAQVSRWMPMDLFDACVGDDLWLTPDHGRDALRGKLAYGGLDLAAKLDLTAWCLLVPDGDVLHALWRFWLPEAAVSGLDKLNGNRITRWARQGWLTITEGDVVDYSRVYADIAADAESFVVGECDADQWSLAPVIQEVEKLIGVWEIDAYQNSYQRMTPGMHELMGLVRQGRFRHHGNPVARWCFDAVEVAKSTADANLIRPVKPDRDRSGKRVDAVPTAAMACSAWQRAPTAQQSVGRKVVVSSR